MTTSLLSAALLLATATASQCPPDWVVGSQGGGVGPSNVDYKTLNSENQRPNETSSVTFTPTWLRDTGSRMLGQWTWTVNVTDIQTSGFNESVEGSALSTNNLTDPHFVNAVYDFQWPGGGELDTYLANATNNASDPVGRLCFAALDLRALPINISNAYQESDNGDCTHSLGESCVNALLAYFGSNSGGSCSAGPGLRSIPECASTLGVPDCSSTFGFELGNSTDAGFLNSTNRSQTYQLTSGQGFYFQASGEQQGGNDTQYDLRTQQLQAVVLSGAVSPMMLCQKVDKTAADASTVMPDGGSSGAGLNSVHAAVATFGGLALLLSAL